MTSAGIDAGVAWALAAFELPVAGAVARRAASGLIQDTYIVSLRDGRRVVVQRMHPVFGAEVLADTEAVTGHLEAAGMATPRLLRTPAGELGARDADSRLWRVLTYLDGETFERVDRPALAGEAAGLVARFHRCVSTLDHRFEFVRAGVHDTAAHLARLELALAQAEPGVRALGEEILGQAHRLPSLPESPRRIAHGDLKISNVLFAAGSLPRALALLDLDTLGRMTMAFELGDALRSWCNPLGEDVEETAFAPAVFEAAIAGYAASAAGLLEPAEVDSLVPGLITVAVELAARFCVDAVLDLYFGWDPGRFPSRREHNRVRAAGQLRLARLVAGARSQAEAVVRAAFT